MDTDGRWLTYGELATIRGTKRVSAVKLAQRERWPRRSSNDKARTVKVLVPAEWLVPTQDQPASLREETEDEPTILPVFSRALEAVEAAHLREVAALREVINGMGARLEDTEDRLRQARADAEERVKRAEGAARTAQEAADELRQAEEARKARGRLRRAWDGWRGR